MKILITFQPINRKIWMKIIYALMNTKYKKKQSLKGKYLETVHFWVMGNREAA